MLFFSFATGQAHYAELARESWLAMMDCKVRGWSAGRIYHAKAFRKYRRLAIGR
jgi:hypothetical protein